jgi:Gpi18-like mannosyltransferase
MLRAASLLTGEFNLTGIALSSLCFFFALVLLHKLAVAYGFGASDADRAVFYLAAFPFSYFFSVPMTESLFLLLTVASFYAAKREQWLVAGLCGALASATRVTGILLFPTLAVLYWETYRTLKPRWNFLPLLLAPVGLLSFMWYLHAITGNALAFKDILVTWGRKPTFFLMTLFEYLRDPLVLAVSWDFRFASFLAVVGVIICGVALVKWRKWSLAAYALASVFLTLSSGLLQSQARYMMVVFPAFLALAVWGRGARADQIIRTVFLILLVLMTIMFAYQIDIALA